MHSLILNNKFACTISRAQYTSETEHKFLAQCIGLCINRMHAEHIEMIMDIQMSGFHVSQQAW